MADENNNVFIENILCLEDSGLFVEWNMCYCRPGSQHIEEAEEELLEQNQNPSFPPLPSVNNSTDDRLNVPATPAISSNQDSNDNEADNALDEVSPRRAKLRKEAYKHLEKQAEYMIRRANMKGGHVNVGDIVQIGISNADLAKTDCKNLTLMVVQEVTHKKAPPQYRLANKSFQMKNLYGLGSITIVKDANPKLLNLEGVLDSYQGLPKFGERQAARQMSIAGGQGVKRCNCKGICLSKLCSCFKNGSKCAPACHKGSRNCKNC